MDYPSNYIALYNASALALKAVHPTLRVGGPATMQVDGRFWVKREEPEYSFVFLSLLFFSPFVLHLHSFIRLLTLIFFFFLLSHSFSVSLFHSLSLFLSPFSLFLGTICWGFYPAHTQHGSPCRFRLHSFLPLRSQLHRRARGTRRCKLLRHHCEG